MSFLAFVQDAKQEEKAGAKDEAPLMAVPGEVWILFEIRKQ